MVAAITSCTNTSNPSVMLAAGLVAKKAAALGLKRAPWVKTSLGPGSMAVTRYLERAGLIEPLKALGFHNVGYGCTVCIGNTGPLPAPVSKAIADHDLCAVSILSGNRNFEGRVHAEVRMNYLASPPLVVAYAIAGRIDLDPYKDPLTQDRRRQARVSQGHLADPGGDRPRHRRERHRQRVQVSLRRRLRRGRALAVTRPPAPTRPTTGRNRPISATRPTSQGMTMEVGVAGDILGARCLAVLGDSITTDHISPAGSIKPNSPAGQYLIAKGVDPKDFNSLGSRRGNHEVMMRGTFANIRLRNLMAPGTEGGVTLHQPSGEQMSIFDAAMKYQAEGTPAIVLAGKEYGSGSSRDWAAKGPRLLGVRAVIAESYERIHRSNLVGMGILPLEFVDGANAQSLGLTGTETFDITGLDNARGQAGPGAGHRRGRVGQDLPGQGPHRHPQRGGLLPPRRHPALRAAQAGGVTASGTRAGSNPALGVLPSGPRRRLTVLDLPFQKPDKLLIYRPLPRTATNHVRLHMRPPAFRSGLGGQLAA